MEKTLNKRPLKGFTLVELIIVITILAILATIVFVSFQGYTKNSRDGNRLSTMNSIEKGLEINYVKTGKYPTPESSNGTEILTGGLSLGGSKVTYSYLGVVGDGITRLIGINKTPRDPLSNSRYIYSTTIDGKKYQVASILEGDIGLNLLTKETYADSGYKARVVGNYKMENLYSYLGTSYLIVTPSIIFDTSGSNILNGTGTKFIVNNLSNLPYSPVNGGTVSNDKIGEDIIRDIRGDNQAEILTVTIPSNITSGGDLLSWINTQSNSGVILKSLGAVSSKSGTLVTSVNTNTLDKIINGTSQNQSSFSCSTQPNYTNANFTIGLPTQINTTWQNSNSNNPCYYTCKSGWSGNDCNIDNDEVLKIAAENISLLTSFTDSSTTNKSISNIGSTTKIGGKIGGVGYFDGNGDYLSLVDSDDWFFGTGDFTIDFMVKFDNITTTHEILSQRVDDNNFIVLAFMNGGGLWLRTMESGVEKISLYQNSSSHGFSPNTWYNISITRSGNNFNIYRNGTSIVSNTSSLSFPNLSAPLYIGTYNTTGYFFPGYLEELRISKGIARSTSVSSVEYSTDLYTKLLIHFDGEGNSFTDSSGTNKTITSYGNTKQFTPKIGEGSIYLNGTSNYLSLVDNNDWNFSNGDFTIDFWAKRGDLGRTQYLLTQDNTSGEPTTNNSFGIYFTADNNIWTSFTVGTNYYNYSPSVSVTDYNWHHYAVVRNGTTITFYLDGVLRGTLKNSSNDIGNSTINNSTSPLYIGRGSWNTTTYFNGYLDQVTISKGKAKWTSNFTPPNN